MTIYALQLLHYTKDCLELSTPYQNQVVSLLNSNDQLSLSLSFLSRPYPSRPLLFHFLAARTGKNKGQVKEKV